MATHLLRFEEMHPRQKIELTLGDELEVVLDGNPTTGYQWQVAMLDMEILDWRGGPIYTASTPGLVGSRGSFSFRFRALKRGRVALKLVYRRPGEEKAHPIKTLLVKVTVR